MTEKVSLHEADDATTTLIAALQPLSMEDLVEAMRSGLSTQTFLFGNRTCFPFAINESKSHSKSKNAEKTFLNHKFDMFNLKSRSKF